MMFNRCAEGMVKFQIPAEPKYVALVRKGVRCIAEATLFTEDEAQDVELAVSEAVTNAVRHSRPLSGKGNVKVVCRVQGSALEVNVRDEGTSAASPKVCVLPPIFQEHGRGNFLMNKLMDRVVTRCTSHGYSVTMTKIHREELAKAS